VSGPVWMIDARRTPVAPRGGAFAALEAHEVGAAPIAAILDETGLPAEAVDCVILGNGVYGGGNPARLCALAAGIPERVPAMTIDTQCCGGLDAIHLAHSLVASRAHEFVLAGGVESYSAAPRRFHRSATGEADVEYQRPPFSPWPERDPDMLDAAALLARQMGITRPEQEAFACQSHADALAARDRLAAECVPLGGLAHDAFTRPIGPKLCARLPVLAGDETHGLTTATTAVEADAGAVCAIVSDGFLAAHPHLKSRAVQLVGGLSMGDDPAMPALAPVAAVRETLARFSLAMDAFDVCELMEAFAVQAIACIRLTGFALERTNPGGGALARGHPVGASGAINAVRLYHEMLLRPDAKRGLAAIAGAGGLAATLVLAR
jgi:acetyl-CoA C-acetyltransferase